MATGAAETRYGMATPATDRLRAMLPFDANRSGIVTGEGVAFFVLESEAHARARGADVLAWVRGYGSLADGYHPSSPEPSGRWEARAMELAQADAGVGPADVDVVIAHATGTPKGDSAEIRALNRVFVEGAGRDELLVTGLKGNTGHTGASAGAMNVMAGMWAMRHGRLPNVAGTTDLDPEIRFDVVLREPRPVDLDVLQVNAFGFGGQDASLVVTRS
jgi:3-oxoacyl-[acyl-carrier-protein] synthase II